MFIAYKANNPEYNNIIEKRYYSNIIITTNM